MSVIVTGSNGFLGGQIAARLGSRSIKVSRSSSDYTADLSTADQLPKLLNLLSNFKITGLIHCAAVTPWSTDPDYSLDLKMATQIVEICRRLSIPKLIFISGWVVYDMSGSPPYPEETTLKPANDYGRSKMDVEEFFKSNLKDIQLINLRTASIYGPGQTSAGLIPNLVKSAFIDSKITINSKTTKRDYLYVEDFAAAVINSLELKQSMDLNIGGGRSMSVESVAEAVRDVFAEDYKKSIKVEVSRPVQEGIPADNQLDISKALKLKILSEPTDFKTGLSAYAKWVKHENNF